MQTGFSKELETIIGYARQEAMRTGCLGIRADHLMLGILRHGDNGAVHALKKAGADISEMKDFLDKSLMQEDFIRQCDEDKVCFTNSSQSVLNAAVLEALKRNRTETRTSDLLLSILSCCPESLSKAFLEENGISRQDLFEALSSDAEPTPATKEKRPGRILGHITVNKSKIFS